MLMLDGHFDYGNGYHGRVYLNPHRIFRQPSLIWRLAQDLHRRPARDRSSAATDVVAGPVMGGALLAHTIAGLLDGRRSLTHPPTSFAPLSLDAERRARRCGRSTAAVVSGKRVLLADDVRNTGKTFERAKASSKRPAARSSRPSRSAIGSRRSSISACRTSRWPSTARPRTIRRPSARCARRGRRSRDSRIRDRAICDSDWELLITDRQSESRIHRLMKSALDRLYASFNHPDSALDPIQIVRRYDAARRSRGRRRSSPPAWRSAASRRSWRRSRPCAAALGPAPAAFVRAFDPARDGAPLRGARASLDARRRSRRAALDPAAAARRARIARSARSPPGSIRPRPTSAPRSSVLRRARAAIDLRPAYGRRPRDAGRALLLHAAVDRIGLQAPESVSALDGAAATASIPAAGRRVPRAPARRAARHAHDSRRPLPAADAARVAGLEDGVRHHGRAARARSGRSGALRLRALPPQHDGRVRLRDEAAATRSARCAGTASRDRRPT